MTNAQGRAPMPMQIRENHAKRMHKAVKQLRELKLPR